MSRRYEIKKIKSAHRVLEVLEYFTPERQQTTVMDIARSMGYPQSSTSELLSYLVSQGYLHCDRRARLYWPSARVALLGAWVNPALFRHGNLLPMMDRLAEDTGAAVVLTSRIDIWSQCVHVVSSATDPAAPQVGAREVLTHSAAGKLFLASLEPEHARKLISRINAEVEPEYRVSVSHFLADIKDVIQREVVGRAISEGRGAIAMLLPQASGAEALALGLHCPLEALTRDTGYYIQNLKSAVQKRLAPEHKSFAPVDTLAAKVMTFAA